MSGQAHIPPNASITKPNAIARRRYFRWSISWKLLAASVAVGAIATGLTIHGLRRMNALNERLTRLVDYSAAKVKVASLLKQDLITITRAEKNLILSTTIDEMQRYLTTIDETLAAMKLHQSQLADLAGDRDRKSLELFMARWNEWQKVHREVRIFSQLNSDVRARNLALGSARESFLELQRALGALARHAAGDAMSASSPEAIPDSSALDPGAAAIVAIVAELMSDAGKIQLAEKRLMLAVSEDQLRQFDEEFAPLEKAAIDHIAQLTTLTDPGLQPLVQEANQALQSYLGVLDEMRSVSSEKGNFFVYEYANGVGGPLADEAERLLDQIIRENETDMQQSRDESRRSYLASRNALLFFSSLGIVLSVMVTYFTGQHIASNIQRLAEYTRTLENTSDLSLPVPQLGEDEVGQLAESFDHLRASLYRQTSELAAVNRALEHKSREMEQFVYTVSHDLSSPLVSCKGLIGLIKEDMAAGDYDEVMASIKRLDGAAEQLRQIIEDLLKLSRIGRKPLQLSTVDVERLVERLAEQFQNRLKQVNSQIVIQSPLPPVIADATDVTRIFDNLFSNAIKYACSGERSTTISVGGQLVDGETRYFIRDQGPGIDPRFHSQIFRLFQRLDTGKPGTGVGLASVEKIMRMHNGRCWVESSVGAGATFWIAFPNSNDPRRNDSDPSADKRSFHPAAGSETSNPWTPSL